MPRHVRAQQQCLNRYMLAGHMPQLSPYTITTATCAMQLQVAALQAVAALAASHEKPQTVTEVHQVVTPMSCV